MISLPVGVSSSRISQPINSIQTFAMTLFWDASLNLAASYELDLSAFSGTISCEGEKWLEFRLSDSLDTLLDTL